jgi:citrate lyase subunit beta/citryl-CoA lyase/(S)-citramalyl-CoA lyase
MTETHRHLRRSLLFTPATRPAAFAKALDSGTDCVCIDLEDAVPPGAKADVRDQAIAFLDGDPRRALRINGLRTAFGLADLAALAAAAPAGGMILLPKVEAAADVAIADAILTECGSGATLGALIESALGLEAVFDIARASPRLEMLVFGGVDLRADMGYGTGEAPLAYGRARVVHGARLAGLHVLDVPELAFRDLDAVTARAETARAHGFTGKTAIHPSNIAPIQAAFTPSPAEIAEAQEVMAAHAASETGLVVRDGKLIEAPVIRAMEARLAIARAAGVL